MIQGISAFVFIAVFAAVVCLLLLLQARRMRQLQRLRRRLGRVGDPASDSLVRSLNAEPEEGLAQLLIESGLGWSAGAFAGRAAIAAAMGMVLGAIMASPGLTLLLPGLGALVVYFFVKAARMQRLKKCDQQMPQALEIMALALRAGHALPSALRLAADEAPLPIAEELGRAADEHALGKPIPQALEAMGQRLPGCDAVNTFIVAVLVLQETGGNLIAVIDRIVENARARASYLARLRALTAEGRTSAKLLAALPPAFAILAAAADPTYADFLLRDPAGRVVAGFAILWWFLGIVVTRRLVKSSVS